MLLTFLYSIIYHRAAKRKTLVVINEIVMPFGLVMTVSLDMQKCDAGKQNLSHLFHLAVLAGIV